MGSLKLSLGGLGEGLGIGPGRWGEACRPPTVSWGWAAPPLRSSLWASLGPCLPLLSASVLLFTPFQVSVFECLFLL